MRRFKIMTVGLLENAIFRPAYILLSFCSFFCIQLPFVNLTCWSYSWQPLKTIMKFMNVCHYTWLLEFMSMSVLPPGGKADMVIIASSQAPNPMDFLVGAIKWVWLWVWNSAVSWGREVGKDYLHSEICLAPLQTLRTPQTVLESPIF